MCSRRPSEIFTRIHGYTSTVASRFRSREERGGGGVCGGSRVWVEVTGEQEGDGNSGYVVDTPLWDKRTYSRSDPT